jgi:hypothetical protein
MTRPPRDVVNCMTLTYGVLSRSLSCISWVCFVFLFLICGARRRFEESGNAIG